MAEKVALLLLVAENDRGLFSRSSVTFHSHALLWSLISIVRRYLYPLCRLNDRLFGSSSIVSPWRGGA